MAYELSADDVVVWIGVRYPVQADVDDAARRANDRGWNGTQLDLSRDGEWLEAIDPSEEVLR